VAVGAVALGFATLTQDDAPTAAPSSSSTTTPSTTTTTTTTTAPTTTVPSLTDAEIAAEYGDAVFRIETAGCQYEGVGSGFAIDEHHIVTNRHVVEIDSTPSINTRNGERFTGRVIGWEELPDIAVIEVDRSLPKWMDWSDTESLAEGQRLVSIGYPLPDHDFSVTPGVIVSFVTRGSHRSAIRSDANLDYGNSGGPSLISDGRVAGVVTEMDLNLEGFQFVPLSMTTDEVYETIEWILEHPSSPTVSCGEIGSGTPPYGSGTPTAPEVPAYEHPTPPFYTVILASLSTSRASAQDAVDRAVDLAWEHGLETAVLLSDNFSSLNPGYWVVYTGVFYDRDPAIDYASYLNAQGIDAYSRQVTW
jgi:hypothetical protein